MNARGKSIDTTHLSIDHAEARGFLHRDYIAHCFRWSYAWRVLSRINSAAARILDIGCGADLPFLRSVLTGRGNFAEYHAVDVRGAVAENARHIVNSSSKREKISLHFGVDVCDLKIEPCHFIVCFEMIEHIEPLHMWHVLKKINSLSVRDDSVILISTPCYDVNVGAADNHVNEINRDVLSSLFQDAGFNINNSYGTFASQSDYLPLMSPAQKQIFDSLREYYDSNVLATIFAPMFPAASRNCVWNLTSVKDPLDKPQQFKLLPKPWGSSKKWEELE